MASAFQRPPSRAMAAPQPTAAAARTKASPQSSSDGSSTQQQVPVGDDRRSPGTSSGSPTEPESPRSSAATAAGASRKRGADWNDSHKKRGEDANTRKRQRTRPRDATCPRDRPVLTLFNVFCFVLPCFFSEPAARGRQPVHV